MEKEKEREKKKEKEREEGAEKEKARVKGGSKYLQGKSKAQRAEALQWVHEQMDKEQEAGFNVGLQESRGRKYRHLRKWKRQHDLKSRRNGKRPRVAQRGLKQSQCW